MRRNSGPNFQLKFRRGWRTLVQFLTASGACGVQCFLARGENHLDYRYEFYAEDHNRITVNTHSAYFEAKLIEQVVAKGEFTYDSISGATPTGAKPSPSGALPTVHMEDTRHAGNIGFDVTAGRHMLTPEFAYSTESDYESYGISLSDAIEFNQKNTTLRYGASHNFDRVLDNVGSRHYHAKDATEVFLGVSQLLSPKTILSANFTYGNEYGYLNDPYRIATFDLVGFAYPEQRPGHKSKEVFLTSLTQAITPLHASIEGSYRFYHDSFGIYGHTLGVTWKQWLGKHVMIEPLFRFYEQSSASFYATSFPGLSPSGGFYSADYRLSRLYSLDYGVRATIVATDFLRFNVGYQRYEMFGLDSKTDSRMYPAAHIVSAGLQLWF